MIEVIEYTDKATEEPLVPLITEAYSDAQVHLRRLPETMQIEFKSHGAAPETGVGGFAYSPDLINAVFDKNFANREEQLANLRGMIFHESFHVNQGFTFTKSPFSALDSAIYEGCATVFERDYANTKPLYGDHSHHSDAELHSWLDQVKEVGTDYFEEEATWHKWAFYNAELKQRWIIYKLGVWLVDKTIERTGLTVIDLQDKTAPEILELSKH